MLDREKVVGHLSDCIEASRRDNTWVFVRKDIVEDAISLLKEQEPVEVIHHEAPYGYPFNTGKCPVCFQQLDEGDKFCRECGQAVKWK